MGRRAAELHRRPTRRRLSERIWWILLFFFLALLLLFIVHHQHQDPSLMPNQEISTEFLTHELNFTQELLSTTSVARQLIDQISLAKAYIIIAKEHGNHNLAWEFSSLVRNCQGLLSEAAETAKPVAIEDALPIISRISKLIYKAQGLHYDISTTITTLKKHVEALEERAVAAVAQSAEFGRLATEAMPKDLHCMTVRLTEEWFEDTSLEKLAEEQKNSPRLVDNNLYHFCVFSDNVMSTSVLVNSTVSNAEHPQQLVFHIITDAVSYRAMAAWFFKNHFKGCTIHVRKIEDLTWLDASYSPLVKQLSESREAKFKSPKPVILLDHLRFYLPEMLPLLEKVVFLEDDVVVQKDITPLFSLDMHGNVIGAVETCLESSHRLYNYLNFSNPLVSSGFDPQACAWAFAQLIKTIVGVVEACHSLGVMHRDLKPENFLFASTDEDAALKATDFGLSIFYKPGDIFSDVVGSPYYVAPEVLRKYYGPEADVWSAGVILYILLSGVPPFWAETEAGIFRQILQGPLDFESEPWPLISDSAKDLIRNMLNRDPKKRFTAHQVLCHPWIVDAGVAPDKPLDSAVLSRLKQFSAMNKLKKMALRVIAERLSEEEIGGLKKLFKMIDTDNSGSITYDELKEGLRRVGSDLMESEIQALMDAADIDNNGTIDYGEFLAATVHMNKLEREENLINAFSFFDKDGSGYITIDELSQACKDFGLGDVHLDEMIREIDQNNDGQIDYSEFAAMMRKGTGGNGAVGRRTMRNSINVNLGDVFRAAEC